MLLCKVIAVCKALTINKVGLAYRMNCGAFFFLSFFLKGESQNVNAPNAIEVGKHKYDHVMMCVNSVGFKKQHTCKVLFLLAWDRCV